MEDELTSRIRAAIAAEDYEEALRLWNRYAGHLREKLAQGTPAAGAFSEAGELVEWSRTVLLCARAHIGDRLRNAHAARAYENKPLPGCGT